MSVFRDVRSHRRLDLESHETKVAALYASNFHSICANCGSKPVGTTNGVPS